MRRIIRLALLCVPLASCERGGDANNSPDAGVSTRDSAGVSIVENSAPDRPWGAPDAWSAARTLTIGSDSAESSRLGQVGDVAVTSDGHLAVLDQAVAQLRVFDRGGTFVRAIGREGRGPGELSRFSTAVLVTPGDSLLVPDPRERRTVVFAPNGDFVRAVSAAALPMGKGWTLEPGGSVLHRGYSTSRTADGRFAFWDALLRVSPDGVTGDTLFEFDHTKTDLGGPGKIRIALVVNNPSWARLADGRIVWSALDRDYVTVHDSTGRRVARWSRAQWKSRPVGDSDKSAMRELLRTKLRALGGDAGVADSPMVEPPSVFPAITAVRAGPGGTIWVQRMGEASAIDPMAINASERSDFFGGPLCDVLDGDGRYLGTLTLPVRFRVFRAQGDTIYGAQRDDDGVEQVVRLTLRRGGGSEVGASAGR